MAGVCKGAISATEAYFMDDTRLVGNRTTEFREGSATAAAMEGHTWFTLRMLLPAVRMRHLLACASSLLVNLV